MSKQVFSSIGKLGAGTYDEIEVDGVMEITGDIVFTNMEIDGVCKGKGALNGKVLGINGVVKTDGDIKVEELEVDGVLKSTQKIYASKIVVDGVISNTEEVNGDIVEIDGVCNLNELVGDRIIIDSVVKHSKGLFGFGKRDLSKVNVVECTHFEGGGVKCERVSANEIILSNGSIVDVVECDGMFTYDKSCKVGTVNGDCRVVVED